MESKIEELKEKFKYLKVDRIEEEETFVEEGETPEIDVYYNITNFNGNKNISITLTKEEQVDELISVLTLDPVLLDEYLGVKYNDKYEIILTPINNRYLPYHIRKQKFEITLNYFKNELKITLDSSIEGLPSIYFNNFLNRFGPSRRSLILTIENYKRTSPDGLNLDLRNILNSVLFDFEYSFNIAFEPMELNSLNRRVPRLKRPSSPIPNHSIFINF